jgi:hypothetical protein
MTHSFYLIPFDRTRCRHPFWAWHFNKNDDSFINYEVCASFYPHRVGDSFCCAGSDGPNNVSPHSSACRGCASAKGPAESASAAQNKLIKCPNRGLSKRPESATVSASFRARERCLGTEQRVGGGQRKPGAHPWNGRITRRSEPSPLSGASYSRGAHDAPAPCCSAGGRVCRWSEWRAGIRACRRRPAISAGPSGHGRGHTLRRVVAKPVA